jgi:tripartite-type tricarboxylate transporter receptor subunit TctC
MKGNRFQAVKHHASAVRLTTPVRRWRAGFSLLAIALVGAMPPAMAQTFPSKPVRLIVPAEPGGGLDIPARSLAQGLTQRFGQTVFVENVVGSAQQLGVNALVRAAPDGHTILYGGSTPITIAENFDPKPPYDARRDLVGVAVVARNPRLIVTHPDVKANTLTEFVALAKQQPGKLFYGSPGIGHSFHLLTELLSTQMGIKMTHVPYKGSAPANRGMLGGEVQFLIQSPEAVISFLKAGKMRALATLDHNPLDSMPDIPTLSQAGAKDLDFEEGWHGIYAPVKTPREVLAVIEREVTGLVKSPDYAAKLRAMNFVPVGTGMADIARRLETEFRVWPQVVKASNIQSSRE